MPAKGIGDLRSLILLPFFIMVTATLLISFANSVCQTLTENCGYLRAIAYTLIGAIVVGAVFYFKFKFFA